VLPDKKTIAYQSTPDYTATRPVLAPKIFICGVGYNPGGLGDKRPAVGSRGEAPVGGLGELKQLADIVYRF